VSAHAGGRTPRSCIDGWCGLHSVPPGPNGSIRRAVSAIAGKRARPDPRLRRPTQSLHS
jgi:hypothetical protein